jgi:hypothetical protein
MRRYAGAVLLTSVLAGCMTVDTGVETGGVRPHFGKGYGPPPVPGLQGPYGTSVPMIAPYSSAPPPNPVIARQMMSQNMPMNMIQFNNPGAMQGPGGAQVPATPVPAGGILSPPGMPFAPGAPPGPGPINQTSFQPGPGGMMPGGMMPANMPQGGMPGGIMQAQYALNPAMAGHPIVAQRTQVRFTRPTGMKVSWFTQGPAGPQFSTTPIEVPGRYNFVQGAKYRLKLSNIEGRPGVEVYPTMEVVAGNPKTEAFLAHSSVPVEFTTEDLKQIAEGNYVIKVIYLPDPAYQDVAGTGTDEILSTRLEPGQDPVQEALRRGSILLIIRMGNIDQEAPNTPPLGTPGPAATHGPVLGPTMPGPGRPPVQVPYWGMPGMAPNVPGLPPQPGTLPPATPGLPPGAVPANPNLPPGAPAPFVPPAPKKIGDTTPANPVRPAVGGNTAPALLPAPVSSGAKETPTTPVILPAPTGPAPTVGGPGLPPLPSLLPGASVEKT